MLHNFCIKLLLLLFGRRKVQNLKEIIWPHLTWLMIIRGPCEEGSVPRDAAHIMFLAGQALCWTQHQDTYRLQEINVSFKKKPTLSGEKSLWTQHPFLPVSCAWESERQTTFCELRSSCCNLASEMFQGSFWTAPALPQHLAGKKASLLPQSHPSLPTLLSDLAKKKKARVVIKMLLSRNGNWKVPTCCSHVILGVCGKRELRTQ